MTDPTPKPRPTAMLEAACARNPRRFALVTAFAAACAVSGLALATLAGLGACVAAAVAIVAGPGESPWWAWPLLPLGIYFSCTGVLAMRAPPAPLPPVPPLSAEAAPKLFHLLGKIARKTGVPLPREVVLGKDMAVAVSMKARWGVLGWHRRTLVLGLPVLMALDVKQLAGLVAHALVHDGGLQPPFGAWLGRMRATWAGIARSQQADAATPEPWRRAMRLAGQGVAGLFLRHVFPRFDERALVLSRHRAFAADRMARRVAGSQPAVDALVRLAVQRSYLDQAFWPEVFNRASHAPTPNVLPYRAMGQRFRVARAHAKAPVWLATALQHDAGPSDTHPCLRDRLARLKLSARLVTPPKHSAAELLLREALDPLVIQMDLRWQLDSAALWGRLHVEHVAQHRLEKELQVDGEKGALHADDHLLWARAARSGQGDAAFEALLRLMLIDHPDDACARHELGCLLIDKTERAPMEEGAQLLRQLALEQTNAQSLPAARRYGQWLGLQEARTEEAAFWSDEIRRIEHLAQEAEAGLLDFDNAQSFGPPGVSARSLRRIGDALAEQTDIEQAYLVMKAVPGFPNWRFAVLLVQMRQAGRRQRWAEVSSRTREVLRALSLPLTVEVVDAADASWSTPPRQALVDRIRTVPGASLIDRSEPAPTTSSQPSSASSRYMPA